MNKSLLIVASLLLVLRAGAAYGLDVTLGQTGADHTDLEAAVSAVHDAGVDGMVTILDNGFYQGSNIITLPVNIVIQGNPLDPPTLKPRDTCMHGKNTIGQTAADCGGMDDDPVTTTIDERTHGMAIIHVQGGNRRPDLDVPLPDRNTAPSLPAIPLDGGSVTFNGIFFQSCASGGQERQCQFVQIGDGWYWCYPGPQAMLVGDYFGPNDPCAPGDPGRSSDRHPVQNYTVSFNDCIFEDVESGGAIWANAGANLILIWGAVQDTTLNFDNCIIPWNGGGIHGHCGGAFIAARRLNEQQSVQDGPSGLDINFNQCSIVDDSPNVTYHNFIHTRKQDTVVTVKNSIIWPSRAPFGEDFAHQARFARSFNGTNAGACHEYDFPAAGDDTSTVANGGTGYAVDDRLTVVGGTQNILLPGIQGGTPDCNVYGNPRSAVFRVVEVSGGAVTKVEWVGLERRPADPGEMCGNTLISDPNTRPNGVCSGVYDKDGRPANPVTTTAETGVGTGATLNVVWADDILGTLLTGEISNSVARWDATDPFNCYDWFNQTDLHGFVTLGANVVHELCDTTPPDPCRCRANTILLRPEGLAFPLGDNRRPLDLMDGHELAVDSPAIGLGDLGQNVGWRRPIGACELPGGAGGGTTCEQLGDAACEAQGGTYGGHGTACPGGSQLPGNSNQDTSLDLSDVVTLLGFLFQGRPASLPCSTDAANLAFLDVNTDTAIDLSDGIFLLAFLFQGGPPPDQGPSCITIVDCPQSPGCP